MIRVVGVGLEPVSVRTLTPATPLPQPAPERLPFPSQSPTNGPASQRLGLDLGTVPVVSRSIQGLRVFDYGGLIYRTSVLSPRGTKTDDGRTIRPVTPTRSFFSTRTLAVQDLTVGRGRGETLKGTPPSTLVPSRLLGRDGIRGSRG